MGYHWDQQWECDAVLSTKGTKIKKNHGNNVWFKSKSNYELL